MHINQNEHSPQQQATNYAPPTQATPTNDTPTTTGIPKNMKAGFEYSWGISREEVQVHYNSELPAQKGDGKTYLQGYDIYLAPIAHTSQHHQKQRAAHGRLRPHR